MAEIHLVEAEFHRVEGFSDGDTACMKCGKQFHMYWNGGELDTHLCCGLTYKTEHVRTDLVVYSKDVSWEQSSG